MLHFCKSKKNNNNNDDLFCQINTWSRLWAGEGEKCVGWAGA